MGTTQKKQVVLMMFVIACYRENGLSVTLDLSQKNYFKIENETSGDCLGSQLSPS